MSLIRRAARTFFTGAVAVLLLFEEWGWAPLAAVMASLARLPLWAKLEQLISGLPPRGALLVLFVPALALLPVKVAALYFVGKGYPLAGLAVLVAAKLAGTALLARVFALTQPALMQLSWFARWYPRWTVWKNTVMNEVRHSAPWRAALRWKAQARVRWAALLRR